MIDFCAIGALICLTHWNLLDGDSTDHPVWNLQSIRCSVLWLLGPSLAPLFKLLRLSFWEKKNTLISSLQPRESIFITFKFKCSLGKIECTRNHKSHYLCVSALDGCVVYKRWSLQAWS